MESCVFVIVEGDDDGSGDVFITPNELKSIIKIIEDHGADFPTRPRGEGKGGIAVIVIIASTN